MILVIGEILIDRFEDYERIGGAPFNFASHIKQMGWPVRFLTRIGEDSLGGQILQRLQSSGFEPEDVQIDPHHPTGVVDVTLDGQGIPQFQICEDAAYDHLDLRRIPGIDLSSLRMIYFGSLIQRTSQGHQNVQSLLERIHPNTCSFCDINLRPPHINPEAIRSSLHHADILKLNTEELAHISTMFNGPQNEADAVDWLMRTHDISQLALTSGSRGSKVISEGQTLASPPAKVDTVVDTVGAGDAYAAVFAAGVLKGLPMAVVLELATDFAAQICGLPGAVPSGPAPYRLLRQRLKP